MLPEVFYVRDLLLPAQCETGTLTQSLYAVPHHIDPHHEDMFTKHRISATKQRDRVRDLCTEFMRRENFVS